MPGGVLASLPSLPSLPSRRVAQAELASLASCSPSALRSSSSSCAASPGLTPDQADALAAVLGLSAPSASLLSATSARCFFGRWPWRRCGPLTATAEGRRRLTRPALVAVAEEAAGQAKHVHVLKFFGDVTASQVSCYARR